MVSFEMPYKICENIDILFFLIPENIPETKFLLIRNIFFLFYALFIIHSLQPSLDSCLFLWYPVHMGQSIYVVPTHT